MQSTNKVLKDWTDADFLAWANETMTVGSPLTNERVAQHVFNTKNKKQGSVKEAMALIKASAPSTDASSKAPQTDSKQEPVKTDPTPTTTPQKTPEPTPAESKPVTNTSEHNQTAPVQPSDESAHTPPKTKATKAAAPKTSATARETMAQSNPTAKIVFDHLDNYIETMKPGIAHHGNEGASQQVRLFRTIQTILRQKGSDFNAMFGQLLSLIHEHRQDVFNERYLFRYFDQLSLTSRERRNFERLLSLFIDTCDPKLRNKVSERVDISAVMEGYGDNEAQQRVMSFYTAL